MRNVLFLCTANSARSILAEAILNARGGDRFRAFSAGSQPRGTINPAALRLLERKGYPTTGLGSKSWAAFAGPDAPLLDIVITVCDNAAGETCPIWPGHPLTAHWGVFDPAAVEGSEAEIDAAFDVAHDRLEDRIMRMLALPDVGDIAALRAIGQRAAA